MRKYYVLYNTYAGNNHGREIAERLENIIKDETPVYYDMTEISSYSGFFDQISDEKIVVVGGDGTLNRFVNETQYIDVKNEIYLFPAGSGNDFLNDIGENGGGKIVNITKYIKELPTAIVNGQRLKFVNGIGFGIDGYCCEEGDKLRKKSSKPINYTPIAIKGLMGGFHTVNAEITIDGMTKTYDHVWLAPTMNGRFYGGGMMITPNQDRSNPDRLVSLAVFHCKSKLEALIKFPTIFKGTHLKFTKIFEVMTGHEIKVRFDRPTPLQIDGETISGISEYSVTSPSPAKK